MNWLPIDTYDCLGKKPKHAVFYFKEFGTINQRGMYLYPIIQLTRNFGRRICTHWMPLPNPPEAV